jgi:hypothetical protein
MAKFQPLVSQVSNYADAPFFVAPRFSEYADGSMVD